jgi:uncharacterized membrane protein SpoIIM required for sporulation
MSMVLDVFILDYRMGGFFSLRFLSGIDIYLFAFSIFPTSTSSARIQYRARHERIPDNNRTSFFFPSLIRGYTSMNLTTFLEVTFPAGWSANVPLINGSFVGSAPSLQSSNALAGNFGPSGN